MLKERVISSVLGLLILIAFLGLNAYLSVNHINNDSLPLLTLILIMAGVSGYEVSRILRNRYPDANKWNGVYAALIIPFIVHAVRPWGSPYGEQPIMGNIGLFIATIGAAGCVMALFLEVWGDVEKRGKTGLKENLVVVPISLYVGVCTSFLLLLGSSKEYISVIVYTFVLVIVFDVSCYFIGSFLKGKKLFPKISPNKTWAGTLGGIVCTTIASFIFYYIPSFWGVQSLSTILSPLHMIIMGAVIAVFAQCGDLLESAYKRWGEVKDAGKVLPGHGGFLDRFDSLFLAAPTVYVLLIIFVK